MIIFAIILIKKKKTKPDGWIDGWYKNYKKCSGGINGKWNKNTTNVKKRKGKRKVERNLK